MEKETPIPQVLCDDKIRDGVRGLAGEVAGDLEGRTPVFIGVLKGERLVGMRDTA